MESKPASFCPSHHCDRFSSTKKKGTYLEGGKWAALIEGLTIHCCKPNRQMTSNIRMCARCIIRIPDYMAFLHQSVSETVSEKHSGGYEVRASDTFGTQCTHAPGPCAVKMGKKPAFTGNSPACAAACTHVLQDHCIFCVVLSGAHTHQLFCGMKVCSTRHPTKVCGVAHQCSA